MTEHRSYTKEPLEIRSTGGKNTLLGYAAIFDSPSRDLGGFIERVDARAFERCLAAKPDIMARFEHQGGVSLLGRTSSGTLQVWTDKRGLKYSVDLPDTEAGRTAAELVRRGDISQSSFAFSVEPQGEEWDWSTQPATRTLKDVQLYDVAPVSDPAYPSTSVHAVRSFEEAKRRHENRARLEKIRAGMKESNRK